MSVSGVIHDPTLAPGDETAPDGAPAAVERDRRPKRGRRAPAWWVLGSALMIALGIAAASVHVSAHRTFDSAVTELQLAGDDSRVAGDRLRARLEIRAESVVVADALLAATGDDLVDVAARARLSAAEAASAAAIRAAHWQLDEPVGLPSTEKPFWTWELWDAAAELETGTSGLVDRIDRLAESAAAVDATGTALQDGVTALYASVAPAAAALEAANASALPGAVLDFRDAAAVAAAAHTLDSGAVQAFEEYSAKAGALKESAAAELADKAGPLLATRLEIEAFARSIAGGVLLDFDWASVVNGRSGPEWMSGNASWDESRGGFSTITLSNTVAENWPDPNARALVVHEVGHAITAKCGDMFNSYDAAASEAWATAWAISRGETAEGNGVQAYGYPPQELIDVAATCR